MRDYMATVTGEVTMGSEFILFSAVDTTDRKRRRACCREVRRDSRSSQRQGVTMFDSSQFRDGPTTTPSQFVMRDGETL